MTENEKRILKNQEKILLTLNDLLTPCCKGSLIEKRISENQEIILSTFNKLLTPYCKKGSLLDPIKKTQTHIEIVNAYIETRQFLEKDFYKIREKGNK